MIQWNLELHSNKHGIKQDHQITDIEINSKPGKKSIKW